MLLLLLCVCIGTGWGFSPVNIAILDDGIESRVADQLGVVALYDWVGVPLNGPPRDEKGMISPARHATTVASVITWHMYTRECDNTCAGVLLYSHRVFTGSQMSFSVWLLNALKRAARDEVEILNLSFGVYEYDEVVVSALSRLAFLGRLVVAVVALGSNDGLRQSTLACLPGVITVGSGAPRPVRAKDGGDCSVVWVPTDAVSSTLPGTSTAEKRRGVSFAVAAVSGALAGYFATLPEYERSGYFSELADYERATWMHNNWVSNLNSPLWVHVNRTLYK